MSSKQGGRCHENQDFPIAPRAACGLDVRLKIARQMAGGIGVVAVRDGVQKYLPERSWWKRRPTLPKDLSLREVR